MRCRALLHWRDLPSWSGLIVKVELVLSLRGHEVGTSCVRQKWIDKSAEFPNWDACQTFMDLARRPAVAKGRLPISY